MTIPRTVDDLTPAVVQRGARPHDHLGRADAARCGRRPGRPAVPARARRSRRAVDGGREARGAHRRGPLRRDRAQHVRTRGRLLHASSRRAPTIEHPGCYYAAHDAETQDTVLLLEDVSPRGRMLDQVAGCSVRRCPVGHPVPRQAARVLLGRRVARRHAVPAQAAVRRPVSRRGGVRVRDRVAARAGVLPRPDHRRGAGVRRRVHRARSRAVREAVRAAARAVARRLASRQPVLHARRRRDRGRLAADRPFGRPARSRVLRDRRASTSTDPAEYQTAFDDLHVATSPSTACTPTSEWAFEMYRYGTVLGFVYPVIAAGALTIEDPRHIEV